MTGKHHIAAIGIGWILICLSGCAGRMEDTEASAVSQTDSESTNLGEDGWIPLENGSTDEEPIGLRDGAAFGAMERVGTDAPYYCNLEENIAIQGLSDAEEQVRSLVCRDPVYGITYYVNRGRDNYIYAIRDGKNMAAVELPAGELFCREGILYFTLKHYPDDGLSAELDGAVLSYDPVDGAVRRLTEQKGDFIQVYPDGIAICRSRMVFQDQEIAIGSLESEFYFYSFADGSTKKLEPEIKQTDRLFGNYFYPVIEKLPREEEDEYHQLMRENGYQGDFYRSVELLLVDPAGNRQGVLKGRTELPAFCRVKGDEIYFCEVQKEGDEHIERLMCYSPASGETTRVFDSAMYAGEKFTFIGDACYFADGGLRVSLTDGRQSCLKLVKRGKMPAFYTDGERIFWYDGETIWEYREEENTGMEPYEQMGVLSIPYYMFDYVITLTELGKEYLP